MRFKTVAEVIRDQKFQLKLNSEENNNKKIDDFDTEGYTFEYNEDGNITRILSVRNELLVAAIWYDTTKLKCVAFSNAFKNYNIEEIICNKESFIHNDKRKALRRMYKSIFEIEVLSNSFAMNNIIRHFKTPNPVDFDESYVNKKHSYNNTHMKAQYDKKGNCIYFKKSKTDSSDTIFYTIHRKFNENDTLKICEFNDRYKNNYKITYKYWQDSNIPKNYHDSEGNDEYMIREIIRDKFNRIHLISFHEYIISSDQNERITQIDYIDGTTWQLQKIKRICYDKSDNIIHLYNNHYSYIDFIYKYNSERASDNDDMCIYYYESDDYKLDYLDHLIEII